MVVFIGILALASLGAYCYLSFEMLRPSSPMMQI